LVVARRMSGLPVAERVTAFGVLATAAVIAVHLLPGAVGLLAEPSVLVVSAALLVATWRLVPHSAAADCSRAYPAPLARSGRLATAMAALAVAAVAVYLLALALAHASAPTRHFDMMGFHLPGVAEWIRTGSVWWVHQWVP